MNASKSKNYLTVKELLSEPWPLHLLLIPLVGRTLHQKFSQILNHPDMAFHIYQEGPGKSFHSDFWVPEMTDFLRLPLRGVTETMSSAGA